MLALNSEPYHDIRYNLMAVVADRVITCEEKLKQLNGERWITCKIYLFIYCIWVGYFVCLIAELHMGKQPYSYNVRKFILVINPWGILFVVTWTYFCLSVCPHQGNQCEMSRALACVGACNLIVHIHVVFNWQRSKLGKGSFALAFAKWILDTHVRVIDIMV